METMETIECKKRYLFSFPKESGLGILQKNNDMWIAQLNIGHKKILILCVLYATFWVTATVWPISWQVIINTFLFPSGSHLSNPNHMLGIQTKIKHILFRSLVRKSIMKFPQKGVHALIIKSYLNKVKKFFCQTGKVESRLAVNSAKPSCNLDISFFC